MVAVCRAPLAVGLPLLPERLDEGEHSVAHRLKHLLRRGLFEARPAELVLLGGENRILDGFAGAGGLGLFECVQLVEPLDEEQVGELLDDRERIRDATGPHRVPDVVHFGFESAGDHDLKINPTCSVATSRQRLGVHTLYAALDGGALGTVRWFVESTYWTLRL